MIRHWKFAVRVVCYILLLSLIICGVNYIFLPKKYYDQAYSTTLTYKSFYQLDRNSVDVLFVGSSHAANAFNPQVLYDEYGIRSYNLGCEQQNVLVSYYWITEALQTQSPQAVIIDPFMLAQYFQYEPLNTSESCTRMAIDPMRMSTNKLNAIRDICEIDTNQDFNSYIFTNKRFHTRWTNLNEQDFVFPNVEVATNLKGFSVISQKVEDKGFEPYTNLETDNIAIIPPVMMEYMDKIVELCEANNIRLILVKTPSKEWNIAKHNVVADYANEKGIPFYDINVKDVYDQCGFDFDEDMGNPGHVNIWGAAKITSFIGELLSEECSIEGVKDAQWDESEGCYLAELENASIQFIDNFDAFISAIRNERYIVFVSTQRGIDGFKTDQLMETMRELGLSMDIPSFDSYCAAVDAGRVLVEEHSNEVVSCNGNDVGKKVKYRLISTNYYTGGDTSIIVNGANYSKMQNGMNIVVFDKITNKIVDSINYNGDINR